MQKIQFDSEVCRNLERSSRLEWLETNGLGGFACGTVAGMNTRRYHGYLTAALNPPVGRAVLLSKVEETLVVDGERFELSANRYPGTVHPKGFSRLESFTLDPFPVWVYQCGEARLEKTLFLVYGTNTLVLEYRLKSSGEAQLELRPQLAFRDYHALSHKNDYFDGRIGSRPKLVSIQPYSGMPVLHFGHNAESVQPTGDW
ncbi:MAG TPA: glycogen debranching enzyme N-terminal domain-containing protein, partial [Bryobacteraceae bacterium]|nr:glycogen debranching enzyme N-terminal domain-containing protein [Bryobacteraceae bacterium]